MRTNALVISQVVLSITLPLPMVALLKFTRRPDLMGRSAPVVTDDRSRLDRAVDV
jgi:Mn2+/Fe2+ NRAMP family transporter